MEKKKEEGFLLGQKSILPGTIIIPDFNSK